MYLKFERRNVKSWVKVCKKCDIWPERMNLESQNIPEEGTRETFVGLLSNELGQQACI